MRSRPICWLTIMRSILIKAFNSYVHGKVTVRYGSRITALPALICGKNWGSTVLVCNRVTHSRVRMMIRPDNSSRASYIRYELCEKIRHGVEMEIAGNATERYIKYIENAVKLGCMDTGCHHVLSGWRSGGVL